VEVDHERFEERRIVEEAVHRLELGGHPKHISGRMASHKVGLRV
jgi:hypothetical protein